MNQNPEQPVEAEVDDGGADAALAVAGEQPAARRGRRRRRAGTEAPGAMPATGPADGGQDVVTVGPEVVGTVATASGDGPTELEPAGPNGPPGGGRVRLATPATSSPVFVPPAGTLAADAERLVPVSRDHAGSVAESVVAIDQGAAEHWDDRLWNGGHP